MSQEELEPELIALNSDEDYDEIRPVEPEDDIMNDPMIRRMEPNLLLILTHFRLGNRVIRNFATNQIRYHELASLDREDLRMLGIENERLQDELIAEFRNLQGQDADWAAEVRGWQEEPKIPVNHELTVIDMIQGQLNSMNMLLAATIIKVGINRNNQSPGVVINNNFNPPDLVIQLLQVMSEHTSQMVDLIKVLQSQQDMQEKAAELQQEARKKKGLKVLLIGSGVILGLLIVTKLCSRR